MSDSNDLDALLATRFDSAHTHIAAEPFVAATLREIRSVQQRAATLRIGVHVAAVLLMISVSPWLIFAADQLNALLQSSLNWTADQPVAWACVAAALAVVLGIRRLRRR